MKIDLSSEVKVLATEFAKSKGALDDQQRTNFYRDKHKKCTDPLKLAERMNRVEYVKDYLDAMVKYINAEHDVLRLELIPAAMEEEGIENVTIEGIGRLGLTGDMYVSIKADCKDKFFAWLKKNRLGDLIQPTVNSSTLRAMVKSRMTAAPKPKPVPKDLLNITPFTRASITAVAAKSK